MQDHEQIAKEIATLAHDYKGLNLEHIECAWMVGNAWVDIRSLDSHWMKNPLFDLKLLLGCVFYAGTIYGKREVRARKNKKGRQQVRVLAAREISV